MREYGFNIPIVGLKTQAHTQDGHEELSNLIVEDGYWRVPDAPSFVRWTDSVFWTKENGLYPIMTSNSINAQHAYRVNTMIPFGTPDGEGARTLLVSNIGQAYGFAEFVGDTWVLSAGSKLVYSINGVVASVSNTLQSRKIDYLCSHLKSRLIWSKSDTVSWSAIGVPELVQICTGASIPSSVKLLNQSHSIRFKNTAGIYALGDNVILYGTDRIMALRPIENGQTYGVFEIENLPRFIGLYEFSPHPFANNDYHLFIGSDKNIWKIDKDLRATEIGYRWVFDKTLSGSIWITRDATNHGHFFSYLLEDMKVPISYYLNGRGLSGPIPRYISSSVMKDGKQWLTGIPGDTESVSAFLLWTVPFDMSYTGQKKITFVNMSGTGISNLHVIPTYRYTTDADWRYRDPIRANSSGAAFVNVAFNTSQIIVQGNGSSGSKLNRVEVRYQTHDKRFYRGTRAYAGKQEEYDNS